MYLFLDRHQAGQLLSQFLLKFKNDKNLIVLAIPRGGVPVAYEIAQSLNAPMDVFIVRKLGAPNNEEFALGAIANGNIKIIDDAIVDSLNIKPAALEEIIDREEKEIKRREIAYRPNMPVLELKNKTILLIDDGLATGSTMLVAVRAVLKFKPKKIIVAIPLAPPTVVQKIQREVDEVVCLKTPNPFGNVGKWYKNFEPTSDEEVLMLLRKNIDNIVHNFRGNENIL